MKIESRRDGTWGRYNKLLYYTKRFFCDLTHYLRHYHAGLQKYHPYGIYCWNEASHLCIAMPVYRNENLTFFFCRGVGYIAIRLNFNRIAEKCRRHEIYVGPNANPGN